MVQENLTVEGNKIDKVIEYIMNTPENTNPAVLKGMLESLSSEGGSSDVGIANVTFINNSSKEYISIGDGISIGGDLDGVNAPLHVNTLPDFFHNEFPYTSQIILYKGSARLYLDNGDAEISATGNATVEDSEMAIINGDCTITFNDPV